MCWPVIALHFAPSKAASTNASFYKSLSKCGALKLFILDQKFSFV